jgi:GNAT superfamily N-acetyltransferase
VAQVEPLFGPMPDLAEHARRAIGRNSALVVRDRHDQLLGAALLSPPAAGGEAARHASSGYAPGGATGRRIRWLAVRADARRRGVCRALLNQILARWPPPGDIDVVTFGDDVAGGQPARALYASFGFVPAQMLANGPEGGSRQRFVLPQP